MRASEILKLDPLPTSYQALVELMREPLCSEHYAHAAIAVWSLRNAILQELARAQDAGGLKR